MDTRYHIAESESGASVQPPQAADAAPESPRQVKRGESLEKCGFETPQSGGKAFGAFTDFLNATFPTERLGPNPPKALFGRLLGIVGDAFGGMTARGRGMHFYAHSFAFERGGVRFAFGGQRGTGLLSIPGEGCALVPDWPELVRFLSVDLGGRITRWDGAVDDFEGIHSVDWAVQLYQANEFNAGGRRPSCNQHGNWIEPDVRGRTFYVGRRRNGKLLRVYEKGKQLGSAGSNWVRWEVELHNVDREIPWEAVLDPAPFIAGAFPALSWISENGSRIPTIRRADAASYEHLVKHGRLTYGALVNAMLEREGSAERVIDKLWRDGSPKRLAVGQQLGVFKDESS